MIIHSCTLHEKGDSRWIGLPSQKFTKDDGSVSYTPQVEFTNKETRNKFNEAALRAFDAFLARGGGQ